MYIQYSRVHSILSCIFIILVYIQYSRVYSIFSTLSFGGNDVSILFWNKCLVNSCIFSVQIILLLITSKFCTCYRQFIEEPLYVLKYSFWVGTEFLLVSNY